MATQNLSIQNFFVDSLKDLLNADDTIIYLNNVPAVTEGFLVISPDDPDKCEIIYYTAINSGEGSVTCPSLVLGRGLGGTSAKAHVAGEPVKMNITAEYWKELQNGQATNFVDALNIETYRREVLVDGVSSGLVTTQTSGLIGSISAGVAYVQGKRVATTTQTKTFSASKDTYIDLSKDGVFTYVEATLGATEPAFTANSVRIAMVITNGSAIVRIYDRRPWQWIYIQNARAGAYGNEKGMFHNSWVNYDNAWTQASFRKDKFGMVHLRGLIRSGVIATASMVMPKGFQLVTLNQGEIFVVDAGGAFGRTDVKADGAIYHASGSTGYVSLATVKYLAEA